MSQESAQSVSTSIEQTRWRCRSLQMPTILIGLEGELRGDNAIDALDCTELGTALASAMCSARLRELALAWKSQDVPEPMSWCDGLVALPVVVAERRRRQGYLVVLLRMSDVESTMIADGLCGGGAPATLVSTLDQLASYRPTSVRAIGALLHWLQDDAAEIESKDEALESFSDKLTESYEEISLLYKLGHFMTELAAPERFVEQTCEALHATLSFQWISAAFLSDHQLARHMAGARVIHGIEGAARSVVRDVVDYTLDQTIGQQLNTIPAERLNTELGLHLTTDIAIGRVQRGDQTIGIIVAGDKDGADHDISSADLKLIDAAAGLMGIFLENACLYDDQQAMFLGMLEALTAAIDAKDRYTCGHSERVAHLAVQLAQAVGLDDESCERIRITGLVHDIGKIGVPESVLAKPGRLTDGEFELIKRHPEIGVRILRDIPQLSDVLPGVLHHHERWDGSGYPYKLAGENIPMFARLLCLADSFDAMSSTRTYRAAMPRATVLDEIRKGAGTQFDPKFAEIFINLDFSEFDRMVESHLRRDPAVRQSGSAAA